MARAMPSAQAAADAWKTGFGNASQKWQNGINSVTTAPGVLAAARKDAYVSGVTNNSDKWANNVAKVTLADWKNMATTKGGQRFASGAAAGAPKYAAKIGPVLQAIGQLRDGLPPRGDIMTNLARMQAMALGLHERAQQGW